MTDLNMVQLIGRLGADPERHETSNGTEITNFSVATDESYKNTDGERVERVEWHRVVAFGRLAEICNEYLTKGRQVYIQGSLQTRQWEDADGNTRYSTEVKAQSMKMLGSRQDGNSGSDEEAEEAPKKTTRKKTTKKTDKGLPF